MWIFYNAIQKNEILRKRVNVLNYKEYEREGDHDHEKDIPIFNHENIKDFYLAIRYDVKKSIFCNFFDLNDFLKINLDFNPIK